MKKIIKNFDREGYVRITIADERWYQKLNNDGKYVFYPSTTWITEYYPKGVAFFKWLAQQGWDEAEAIKQAAGDKGSKVHYAIRDLIDGKEIPMDAKYYNETLDIDEELTLEEYDCLLSFLKWWNDAKPQIISSEMAVFNEEHFYAGTADFLCKIKDEMYLIDFKTGQTIWPSWELQVSAYRHALGQFEDLKLAILQLGYYRNKNKYKFTEIEDKFELFLAAKRIWQEECSKIEPLKREYPTSIKLDGYL